MAEANRDTIYIDIDDEITGIIDKVRSSQAKIVALVLPKRASVFQSVVNMKLLKRATEQSQKHIVLITSENSLLPLAGAVGIHVASSLTSKPEIPSSPLVDDGKELMVEESASLDDEGVTAETAGDVPVGELAALGGAAAVAPIAADGVETIQMDDDDDNPAEEKIAAAAGAPVAAAAAKKSKKGSTDKKLKVPNFERFRLIVVVLIILLIIIAALILAFKVLPKASISIKTDATLINTNVPLTLDTKAASLNSTTNDVPAKMVSEQKTYTGTANATGQQNNGQEATGSVVMSDVECYPNVDGTPNPVLAGTGVSWSNLTYITQNTATFSVNNVAKNCVTYTSNTVNITAQNPGSNYNTPGSSVTFTVAGQSGVSATGSASGGTDNIQTIVQQSDITNAEAKINPQNSTAKQNLIQQLQQDNLDPIPATFSTGTPTITPSTAAGAPASSVTVTESITYTMYGAPSNDLSTLLNNNVKSQVNTSSQGILNNGLTSASFTTTGSTGTTTSVTMTSSAEVGPSINVATIKQLAAGKKSGDVETAVKNEQNVTNVSVHLSPFWVTTVPTNLAKITVNIAKPTNVSGNGGNS